MRKRYSALASFARHVTLYSLAALLFTVFLAACGSPSGSSSVEITGQNLPDYLSATHTPTPSQYCRRHQYPDDRYLSESYKVDFWRPGIIVVGLASKSGASINLSAGNLVGDVTTAVEQYLQACFPSSGIIVNSLTVGTPQPAVAVDAVALVYLSLNTDTNNLVVGNAELKTAIDAINSSDQPLKASEPNYPLLDPHRIVGEDAIIVGASPDWGMNGQGVDSGGFGGGSPDGPPSVGQHTPTINTGPLGSGKTVYVLDTVPPLKPEAPLNTRHTGGTSFASSYCQGNPDCLRFLQSAPSMDVQDQPMTDESAFICTSLPCNFRTQHPDTAISKHGFFVSEIIHNLAPGATIHLVRVLNDYGVGDLITLTNELSAITSAEASPSDVIVNMSLSIEPPTACIFPLWQLGDASYMSSNTDPALNMSNCGTTTHNALADTARGANLYLKRLLFPLGLVIQEMVSKRFTIVAAAGNDSNGPNSRYGADMPAAFCGVYVAASSKSMASGDWQYSANAMPLSDFSNDPYVIGNNGAMQCLNVPTDRTAASLAQIQLGTALTAKSLVAPGEKVCSLYLHVGDPNDPNDSGVAATEWTATWSGSSFATAMVSGDLAAGAPNPTAPAWNFLEPCD